MGGGRGGGGGHTREEPRARIGCKERDDLQRWEVGREGRRQDRRERGCAYQRRPLTALPFEHRADRGSALARLTEEIVAVGTAAGADGHAARTDVVRLRDGLLDRGEHRAQPERR